MASTDLPLTIGRMAPQSAGRFPPFDGGFGRSARSAEPSRFVLAAPTTGGSMYSDRMSRFSPTTSTGQNRPCRRFP